MYTFMEEQLKMCVMRSDREDDGDENGITDLLKIENQMEKGTYKNRCEMMKVTNDKKTGKQDVSDFFGRTPSDIEQGL
ncbi:unnamed protein product [Brugia pahangi]|uniref:Odorant-binding protein n=1 Tax=Brugia pahangi TaxID=6280 RepID=A0A0N4TU39_BRUPA|nr:unnamed protein product [Brugia pahangi]